MFESIDKKNNLTIIPSVMVWDIEGEFYFDRKFHDGILLYCAYWIGTVTLVMRKADSSLPEFGIVLYDATKFPANLRIIELIKDITLGDIVDADVVLASGDNHRNLHLSSICKSYGIKCIYIIEYILQTRFQIILMSEANIRQKIKSLLWNILTEIKRDRAFTVATALQSNGVPAFNTYNKRVMNTLLYFDSRNTEESSITEAELATRLLSLDNNDPLRLGFSGRLIKMKGTDHLIEVARLLRNMHIPFTFDIFGAGDLTSLMKRKINEYQLEKQVKLKGSVDFTKVLLPFIKANLDLFVCCHRQSDPSCTYLETYSCGVPVIGYANKAHQGILDIVDVGWSSPINDIEALVNKIVYLNSHREEIKLKSNNARQFAAEHTCEKTFNRRIEQCSALVKES